MLNRFQPSLLPSSRCIYSSRFLLQRRGISSTVKSAMTTPVASSSHPAQIPALQGPHAGDVKKPKEKKKVKDMATSAHPLEV